MDKKLPIEVKTKWTEALRSGKYPQDRNRLRGANGFCCLGVLCDLQGAEWKVEVGGWCLQRSNGNSTTWLPDAEHVGEDVFSVLMQKPNGDMTISGVLANMNDRGKSFAEIADYIEKEL